MKTKLKITETCFDHIDEDLHFVITASENWSIKKIKQLKEKYPDDVKIVHENKDGSLVAHVPKDWIKIQPKKNYTLSDAQKKLVVQRLQQGRKNKIG